MYQGHSPAHLTFEGMSQAVAAAGMVVTSGQVAIGTSGELVGPGDPGVQAEQCFRNLISVLDGFGIGLASVLRLNCYLAHRDVYPAYAAVKRTFLGDLEPAGTAVVAAPLDERFLLELEAIAVKGQQ